MRRYYVFLAYFVLITTISCKKDTIGVGKPIGAITVVNAVVGTGAIITDFTSITPIKIYYSNTPQIGFQSFYEFSRPSGTSSFVAYDVSDTIHPLIKLEGHDALDLQPQGIYSIFLCGQVSPSFQPDALIVQDQLPYHPVTDSSIGIRFINLSQGGNPVKVTLSTSTTVSEAGDLAYKSLSGFKNYACNASSPGSYTFQFRDAVSNTLLASVTMSGLRNGTGGNISANRYRFRNFTVVLSGLPGSQRAFIVNNY